MNRLAVACAVCCLLVFLAVPVAAQTKDEGMRVYDEACKLHWSARSKGEFQRVLRKYEQALQILEQAGFLEGVSKAAFSMGVLFTSLGQYDKALKCYEKSLAISHKLGDATLQALALNNIAEVFQTRGQHDKALEFYERSRAIFRKLGDLKGESMTLRDMAKVCWSQGKYVKALQHHLTSRLIKWSLEETGDKKRDAPK